MNSGKNRTFITFSDGELNDQLCEILSKSINQFSNYPLKVYRKSDFSVNFDTTDKEFWKSGKGYIFKILSCLKSLKEFDEVVWIDTDCVVTNYIDKIWFETWRLENYPLLPKYRFTPFESVTVYYGDVSHDHILEKVSNDSFLSKAKQKIGSTNFSRDFYSQACFMLFNRESEDFFNECLSWFTDYDKEAFPLGDETILNCLFWKYDYRNNLGDIFICSHHFGYELLNIIPITNRDELINTLSSKLKYNIYENILFFHGTKLKEIANSIFNQLLLRENNYKVEPNRTNLCEIMEKWGSDKSTWHNYTRLYSPLFSQFINKEINIFELGLGTNNINFESNMGLYGKPGASHRAWREFFKNANVFGADIDQNVLFTEHQIKTYFCDQTNVNSIKEMWNNTELKNIEFDIIIDDGYHEFFANLTFFQNSIDKLKSGGYYIIEDLLPKTVNMFQNILDKLELQYPYLKFDIVKLKWEQNFGGDNTLLIIKKF